MESYTLVQILEAILGKWYGLFFIPCITGIASIMAIFTPKIHNTTTIFAKCYAVVYTILQFLACNIGKAHNAQDTDPNKKIHIPKGISMQ